MRSNKLLICFAAVLVAGVLMGSVLWTKFPRLAVWDMLVFSYGTRNPDSAFLPVFRETALWSLLWLGGIAMLGLTLFAVPSVLALWLLHGVRIGAVLTALYCEQHLLGFVIAAGFVMPYVLASTTLLFFASREALRTGLSLVKAVRGRGAELSLRTYALRFLVLGLGMLFLSLLHGFWMGRLLPLLI